MTRLFVTADVLAKISVRDFLLSERYLACDQKKTRVLRSLIAESPLSNVNYRTVCAWIDRQINM